MKPNKILQMTLLVALLSFVNVSVLAQQPDTATATLPLAEILRLHQAQAASKSKQTDPPPIPFTIEKALFNGRLLDEAIDIKTHYELSVLGDTWVKINLLTLDDKTQIIELPSVKNAYFKQKDNQLIFLTKHAGPYRFDLRFLRFSNKKDEIRSVIIDKQATLSRMELELDSGLFELVSTPTDGQGDKLALYESNNQFNIQWKRISSQPLQKHAQVNKQASDPVVKSAHASVVATLSGENIVRILYKLQFAGRHTIDIVSPENYQVKTIYLNSTSLQFGNDARVLKIPVQPQRAGDEEAILELVLTQRHKGYLLSGELEFQFPKLSWGTNELFVSLNLPTVFNYRWIGGSLAPKDFYEPVHYTHEIPTPGKQLHLHQQLIHGFTDTRFSYTVDLTGLYYNGG